MSINVVMLALDIFPGDTVIRDGQPQRVTDTRFDDSETTLIYRDGTSETFANRARITLKLHNTPGGQAA